MVKKTLSPRIKEINRQTMVLMMVWIGCWTAYRTSTSRGPYEPMAGRGLSEQAFNARILERDRLDAKEDSMRQTGIFIEMGGIMVFAVIAEIRRNRANRMSAMPV